MRSRHKCRGPGKRGRGKRRSGEKDEMEGSGESVGARVSPNPQGKLIPSLNSRRPNSSIAEAIVERVRDDSTEEAAPRQCTAHTGVGTIVSGGAKQIRQKEREERRKGEDGEEGREGEREKGAPPRPGQAGRAARSSPVFSPRAQGTRRGIYGQQGETYLGYYTPSLVKCLA